VKSHPRPTVPAIVPLTARIAPAALALALAACAQGPTQEELARAAAASAAVASSARYPAAPPKPATHEYHGVSVTDNFEWLEDGADPAVKNWVAAENTFSRQYLDAIPARPALHDRLSALMTSTSNAYSHLVERGGLVFALKNAPPKQQPMLVTLKSVDDLSSEHVVFDPNEAAANGSLAIDFFEPSPDGKRVAVSVSENGSENGTLRVLDAATGQELPDRLPRVNFPTGGGSVAWSAGGKGLYYTQYPAPGVRPPADEHFYQQVFFHVLGTPAERDTLEVGADFPRIAETALKSSRDGKVVVALVANGDGGDFSLYLKTPDAKGQGAWRRIAADADGIKAVEIGDDNALYLLSRAGAPRGKLLRLPASAATASVDWKRVPVVVPQSDGTIEQFVPSGNTLYVSELLGGPSRLRVVDTGNRRAVTIGLPAVSGVQDLAKIGKHGVVAELSSYLAPTAWSHVATGRNGVRRTALVETSEANFNDCEIVREFATSKDGTQIPLNVIRRKGTRLDGRNPTILYGYGGYGVSMTPEFRADRRAWLDRGGVFVIANLRGGGEYGEAWHLAGNLTHKQNVFDDFIASAEYLISHGYTNPQSLGILGGSNGGLLMGAAMTQRPELFRAVGSAVGIYDMLRVELDPNGAFNVTEFGTVKDEAQFKALYAYSPLHHVKDGTNYPAVLMQTGDNDGRVNPAHSRKMIARLQQADPNGHPILLRTSASSGHGIGTALSERIEQRTDLYAFFVNELMGGVQ
jgi:prolyl oligopeptidase